MSQRVVSFVDGISSRFERSFFMSSRWMSSTSIVGDEGYSIPLAEVYGIRIGLHWTFVAVASILTLISIIQYLSWKYALLTFLVYFPILLLTTLLQDLGHVLGARQLGGFCDEILLWPLGGMIMCRLPNGTVQEQFWLALCGPVAHVPQLLFWLFLMAVVAPFGTSFFYRPFDIDEFDNGSANIFFAELARAAFVLNLILLLLNIFIPAFPLDCAPMFAAMLTEFGLDIKVVAYATSAIGGFLSTIMLLYGFVAIFTNDGPGWFFFLHGVYLVGTSVCLFYIAFRERTHQHPMFESKCYREAYGGNPTGGSTRWTSHFNGQDPSSIADPSTPAGQYLSKRSLASTDYPYSSRRQDVERAPRERREPQRQKRQQRQPRQQRQRNTPSSERRNDRRYRQGRPSESPPRNRGYSQEDRRPAKSTPRKVPISYQSSSSPEYRSSSMSDDFQSYYDDDFPADYTVDADFTVEADYTYDGTYDDTYDESYYDAENNPSYYNRGWRTDTSGSATDSVRTDSSGSTSDSKELRRQKQPRPDRQRPQQRSHSPPSRRSKNSRPQRNNPRPKQSRKSNNKTRYQELHSLPPPKRSPRTSRFARRNKRRDSSEERKLIPPQERGRPNNSRPQSRSNSPQPRRSNKLPRRYSDSFGSNTSEEWPADKSPQRSRQPNVALSRKHADLQRLDPSRSNTPPRPPRPQSYTRVHQPANVPPPQSFPPQDSSPEHRRSKSRSKQRTNTRRTRQESYPEEPNSPPTSEDVPPRPMYPEIN